MLKKEIALFRAPEDETDEVATIRQGALVRGRVRPIKRPEGRMIDRRMEAWREIWS